MKQFLSMLVIILLISSVAYAESNSIDLKSMSLEELVELHDEIHRILRKEVEKDPVTIGAGTYYAGTDLPAGSYELSYYVISSRIGSNNTARIDTMNANGDIIESNTITSGGYQTDYVKITLPEGGSFTISIVEVSENSSGDGTLKIRPFSLFQ